ncbi:serine/threonine protein kinase, partial [Streptomyces sp. SID3343]|uniref:class III lanthionine synthetase LanKC N-terminal domain-containing protein n=1 Tax=Streptomyces sp. SID3343 TaxID=2690260 RepID=UPI001368755C
MDQLPFLLADPDFYRPIEEAAETGTRYESCALPADWRHVPKALWNVCLPPGGIAATHGWKVHVSATSQRAQHVLSAASAVCVAQGAPFAYLDNALFHTWLHHEHGPPAGGPSGGTFIAAYPPHEAAARRLMVALAAALDGESGPYVPGNRRYCGSMAVAYRYGAFVEIPRLLPDGTREHLVPDGRGRLVPDGQGVCFALPDGVVDPFREDRLPPRADERVPSPRDGAANIGGRGPVRADGEVSFEGFTFTRLIRHSNGGGAYVARRESDGHDVFVKEARRHGGLRFDGSTALARLTREYATLCDLDEKLPGIAPKPVAFLKRWEHGFLITESLPGESLPRWVRRHLPGTRPTAYQDHHHIDDHHHREVDHDRKLDYHRRCLNIFADIVARIDALHDAGYVFVDLSADHVRVDAADTVRLVDFEAAGRIDELPGPPGRFPDRPPPPTDDERARADPYHIDDYGLSRIARLLLFGPMHHVLDREPGAIAHLNRHLWQDGVSRPTPAPERLWRAATRFTAPPSPATLPTPEEVADDPVGRLRELRDRTADALAAMASPGAEPVYPTTRFGYASNVRCVAHGTAGVLHALRVTGRAVDPAVLGRLAHNSLRHRRDTPPGLHSGNAGIAWVLADLGRHDEAN